MSQELIISRDHQPQVALAMTGASFDVAQREGVIGIEADTDAMTYIARAIGYAAQERPMSPLVIVTRAAEPERAVIDKWDDQLPRHRGDPSSSRYFPANSVHESINTPTTNRAGLVALAKQIGAPALTEVTIFEWTDTSRHGRDFATGLLLKRLPLDLPPAPPLWKAIADWWTPKTPHTRIPKDLPPPFIITRRPEVAPSPGQQELR